MVIWLLRALDFVVDCGLHRPFGNHNCNSSATPVASRALGVVRLAASLLRTPAVECRSLRGVKFSLAAKQEGRLLVALKVPQGQATCKMSGSAMRTNVNWLLKPQLSLKLKKSGEAAPNDHLLRGGETEEARGHKGRVEEVDPR